MSHTRFPFTFLWPECSHRLYISKICLLAMYTTGASSKVDILLLMKRKKWALEVSKPLVSLPEIVLGFIPTIL